jgi:hypothetical protein
LDPRPYDSSIAPSPRRILLKGTQELYQSFRKNNRRLSQSGKGALQNNHIIIMAGRGRDPYSRLDFDTSPPHPDDSDYDSPPHSPRDSNMYPHQQAAYDPPLDPHLDAHHRTPSPMNNGYELEDQGPYHPQRQNTGGYPSQQAQMPHWPDNASNILLAQPTVSFECAEWFGATGARRCRRPAVFCSVKTE